MTEPAAACLSPSELREGTFVARAWCPGPVAGPTVVLLDESGVHDISTLAPTMSHLLEQPALLARLSHLSLDIPICSVADLTAHSCPNPETAQQPFLLAPCDLQVVKACGVTFAKSTLERVIEERARGNPDAAQAARDAICQCLGDDLARITPGSEAAARLKERLVALEMWSQYLEVALGPDAEIFTKAPPLASIGSGSEIGIHRRSIWNNPEPEVVLAVNSRGEAVGATLGNDVNLRDFEGRSALLLGKAKDNNGSCALGPAIRLFDDRFALDDITNLDITLKVDGVDEFHLEEVSSMREISRRPLELVAQTLGAHHQYPDGVMLFLGTLFAPTMDRGTPGTGFTHHIGDLVTIRAPGLGTLQNRVNFCDVIPPWTFGIAQLFTHLYQCGAR